MARSELTEPIYDYLIRPGIEPFWYFDCEEVSAALVEALTAHAAGARFFYVAGGIDQICQRLLTEINVRLNSTIERIMTDGTGTKVQAGPIKVNSKTPSTRPSLRRPPPSRTD